MSEHKLQAYVFGIVLFTMCAILIGGALLVGMLLGKESPSGLQRIPQDRPTAPRHYHH